MAAILKFQVANGLFLQERHNMCISAKFHACITKCMILLKKKDLSAGLKQTVET